MPWPHFACLRCITPIDAGQPCPTCAAPPLGLVFPAMNDVVPIDWVLKPGDFRRVPVPATFGEASQWMTYRFYVLRHDQDIDLVGSGYDGVLPCQTALSQRIVASKIATQPLAALNRGLLLGVDFDDFQKRFVLGDDGHHRFAAALRTRFPVVLVWAKSFSTGATSWQAMQWGNFGPPA